MHHYGNSTIFSLIQSLPHLQRAVEKQLYWVCLLYESIPLSAALGANGISQCVLRTPRAVL